jgi:nucleoside-diphosphate kinase
MPEEKTEQTLVLIKPDAMKNSLTGYVLSLLSEFHTGLRFAAAKIVHVSEMLASVHYAEHEGKPFYPSLIQYIMGRLHFADMPDKRRTIALVYQGSGAILKTRDICGPTNPHVAREEKPGCIRSLGTIVPIRDENGKEIGQRMDNLIHASANAADAEAEVKLWFSPTDMPPSMRLYPTETSSDHYYYKDGKLSTSHESGSTGVLAPGDVVWKTDLEVLNAIQKGEEPAYPLERVAAKYLINYIQES